MDFYPGTSGKNLGQVFEDLYKNSDFNYLIFNGMQYVKKGGQWKSSKYTGPNPHTTHVHADYNGKAK